MYSKKFRIAKATKWMTTILVAAMGCLLVGSFVYLYHASQGIASVFPDSSKPSGFPVLPLLSLLSPFLLLFVLALFVGGWSIWSVWAYYIEFHENELHIKRYGLPFKKPMVVAYADILGIRRAYQRGLLDIVLGGKKVISINVGVEGRVDSLIDEFQKHLHSEQVQPNIKSSYRKISLFKKGFAVFGILWVLAILSVLPGFGLASYVAWKTAWPPIFHSPGYIRSVWINEDQETWIAYQKLYSDEWQIVKLTVDQKTDVVMDVKQSLVKYPDLVLAGKDGQPWIIDSDILYHFNGKLWQMVSVNGYQIWNRGPSVVIDYNYWALGRVENTGANFLVKLDLSTGEIEILNLPEELKNEGYYIYDIKSGLGKSLLVAIIKEYSPLYFYSVENGKWEKRGEILDVEWKIPKTIFAFPGERQEPIIQFNGFTIDQTGRIWAVLEKNSESFIGRLDEKPNGWIWSKIEKECDLCSNSYDEILVDKLERVWLGARYGHKNKQEDAYGISDGWGVDVFTPVWGKSAKLVVRYTNHNSGYQVGFGEKGLRMSDDGRIWVAGDRLVWIDSTNAELPRSLPLNSHSPLIALILYGIVIGLLLIFLFVYHFKLKKRDLWYPPRFNS